MEDANQPPARTELNQFECQLKNSPTHTLSKINSGEQVRLLSLVEEINLKSVEEQVSRILQSAHKKRTGFIVVCHNGDPKKLIEEFIRQDESLTPDDFDIGEPESIRPEILRICKDSHSEFREMLSFNYSRVGTDSIGIEIDKESTGLAFEIPICDGKSLVFPGHGCPVKCWNSPDSYRYFVTRIETNALQTV